MPFCRSFFWWPCSYCRWGCDVALFLAAWRGGCTRRDFFAWAVDARQGTGCQWRRVVCLPRMLWLHSALVIVCSVIWAACSVPWLWGRGWEEGNETMKGPVIVEERNLFLQQRFPSPSIDCVEWDPSVSLSCGSVKRPWSEYLLIPCGRLIVFSEAVVFLMHRNVEQRGLFGCLEEEKTSCHRCRSVIL